MNKNVARAWERQDRKEYLSPSQKRRFMRNLRKNNNKL